MRPIAHSRGRFSGGALNPGSRLATWRFVWIWLLLAPVACGGGDGGGGGGEEPMGGSTTAPGSSTGSLSPGSTTPPPSSTTPPLSDTGSGSSGGSTGGDSTGSSGGSTAPDSYEVNWQQSSSGNIDGYRLSIWTDAASAGDSPNDPPAPAVYGPFEIPQPWIPHDSIPNALTYVASFSQLNFVPLPGVTYYLRLAAYNSAGESFSNTLPVMLVPATPSDATSGSSSGSMTSGSSDSSSTASGSMTGSSSDSSGGGAQTTGGSTSMTSVDLDGASEYLASSQALMVGVGDRFTVSLWAKSAASDASRRGLFALRGSDRVPGSLEVAATGQDLELAVYDVLGTSVFQAGYTGVLHAGEWQNLVVAWDAQLDVEPAVFVDGVLVSASTSSGAVAFSDGARHVLLGDGAVDATGTWQGRLGHAAVWDQALGDAEIAEIAARGHTLDLRVETGAYHGQDALLHWWKPGNDPASPGSDYGPADVPISLDDPNGNVDATDVAPDGPALLP